MSSFKCPYCSIVAPVINETTQVRYTSYDKTDCSMGLLSEFDSSAIKVTFHICPSCGKYFIEIQGIGSQTQGLYISYPDNNKAEKFPDYVPMQILTDYEEACAIVNLSPKASATLSRRCIQGMIRDKWETNAKSLYQEISSLKGKIEPSLWQAIDALRQIGNIGAHMESDVNTIIDIEPNEAQMLITLVEILIKEWYITPHERDELLSGITKVNSEKQNKRKKSE